MSRSIDDGAPAGADRPPLVTDIISNKCRPLPLGSAVYKHLFFFSRSQSAKPANKASRSPPRLRERDGRSVWEPGRIQQPSEIGNLASHAPQCNTTTCSSGLGRLRPVISQRRTEYEEAVTRAAGETQVPGQDVGDSGLGLKIDSAVLCRHISYLRLGHEARGNSDRSFSSSHPTPNVQMSRRMLRPSTLPRG